VFHIKIGTTPVGDAVSGRTEQEFRTGAMPKYDVL
jgi:hypothetical protein